MYSPRSLCAYKQSYQSSVTKDSTTKSSYSTLLRPSNDDEQIVKSEILQNIKVNTKRRATSSTSSDIPCKMQQQMKNSITDESTIGIPSRLCSVCGDISTGIHFGGNSCESCKAFFRRSVQCHRYENYKCSNEERCPVNVVTRKVCQFCRYTKCTTVGMKPKWVLSDQEREEKYGSRRKRFRENQTSEEDPDIYKFLTKEEKLLIEDIAHALYQSRATYPLQIPSNLNQYLSSLSSAPIAPPPTNSSTTEKPPNPSANFLIVPIQRLVLFTRMLKDFDLFSEDDKVGLLKGSAIEMMVCSSSTLFDPKTHTFTNYLSRDQRAALDDQVIPLDPLLIRLWGEDLFHRTKHFLVSMRNLHVDEVTSTLLAPIILFSPDSSNIKDVQLVKSLQIKYVTLLRKYMNWRYGIELTDNIYPKLLLQIVTIRTLSLAHAEIIQKVMSTSSVNPLVQEVTIKEEVLTKSGPTLRRERIDSLSSASTPADNDRMDYDKTPSVDTESNIGSDEDEITRDKPRLSVDDTRSYENEDSNETNPRNIWRKRQKLSSVTETEVINLEQANSPKIKQELMHSNSTDSEKNSNPNYSHIRPYDHQVPNYVRTFSDDSTRASQTSSVRHLSPKKQMLLAKRDSSHKQMYHANSSPRNDISYDHHSRANPISNSAMLPPAQQSYDDNYRQHISRMPTASSQQQQQTEEHFHHLSLVANNQSPAQSIQSPSSQQSHSSTLLNAAEQQLLDAIHAHPNKRDLVLNLLRQMNESSLPSSTEHQTNNHNQREQQRRSQSSLKYNPYDKHSNMNQNNDLC